MWRSWLQALKVYVSRKRSAAAEASLFGKGGQSKTEEDAPDNLDGYEKEMGYVIEPFNTQEERRTGEFDASGFYMKDKDDDEATVCTARIRRGGGRWAVVGREALQVCHM